MPDYITCTQTNCVHHMGRCTCGVEFVFVGSLGDGKHNTLCHRYLDRSYGAMRERPQAEEPSAASEKPHGEADSPLSAVCGMPVLCAAQSCRYNSDANCILEQPVYFAKSRARLAPICTCYRR